MPIFNASSYPAYLPENAAPGTLVATIYATDADIGQNAAITYTLLTSTDVFVLTTMPAGYALVTIKVKT